MEIKMDALKETTINVKTETGDVERSAMISEFCPGLAIAHSGFARFNVTHIQTGTKIGPNFKLFGDAFLLFSKLALIAKDNEISWDVDKPAVMKNMELIADAPVPFDHTVTHMGEERKVNCKEFFEGLNFYDLHSLLNGEVDREEEALIMLEKCIPDCELSK